MGIKKDRFRAFRGLDANKFYMFKNDTRRKSFMGIDKVLKIIYKLAFTVFVLSLMGVAFGIVLWIMSYVLVIGFTVPIQDNIGVVIMGWSVVVAGYSLWVYAGSYIVRFITEWVFILAESKELKKDPEGNAKYIIIGKAVKKSKLLGFAATALLVTSIAILTTSFKIDDSDPFNAVSITCLVLLVLALILNKIFSTKFFLAVQPQINEVMEELKEIKTEKKEEKHQIKQVSVNETCQYCGYTFVINERECPGCGAAHKVKKATSDKSGEPDKKD